ncbi:MAG: response regulator [Anaerolineales bacterium]|jgi:pilus assembly protein CpaE|uniref:response regulator n=1 Tax=Candidatus Villigracilis affinis TaxID=3140682 RepID=UPI001B493F88|nr:response regulator [Anaerolineales bacterium]MBK9600383.1 response regulator [Anaerolineales bacterium]MBL0346855.1 response regulator [Anaerolineales bacterium]MBP8047784.1 response regulator [Anaerolineales bacterium]
MAEKILIIDDDVDTLRLVGLMLQRQGYEISAASNGTQGLAKALEERPNLILLDVMMPDMDGYEVTRRLRKNPVTVSIPILMFTAKTQLDDKVIGFEVGADDYLTKPTHPTELQAHVKVLLARQKDVTEIVTSSKEHVGYVVGVLSARGGLGVSSVAANLAAGLYNRTQADVILAEFTPGQGTLGMDLGAPNQKGLTELLEGTTAEVTREKVKSLLVSHNSGLKLMLASENPRDVTLNSKVPNYEAIVAQLSTLGRFVILDMGNGLPVYVQKLLPMCTERIIVVEGVPGSIQHTRLLIDEIVNLKIDRKTINVVLNNRMRTEAQMQLNQVQEQLGHSVAATLTPAPEAFLQATRLQTPVVVGQPTNMTSQQFLKLADAVLEREKAR